MQATIGAGRSEEDFAVLLDLQAKSAGLDLKPEDTPVDDGLVPETQTRRRSSTARSPVPPDATLDPTAHRRAVGRAVD